MDAVITKALTTLEAIDHAEVAILKAVLCVIDHYGGYVSPAGAVLPYQLQEAQIIPRGPFLLWS